jgi:hypothetical protein
MNDYKETTTILSGNEIFIKVAVSNWELQNTRLNGLLAKLTDEQLVAQVAPGRNRGIYILGHLVAVSDGMLPLLGFGEKLFPGLEDLFIKNPDNFGVTYPSVAELRSYWNQVNAALTDYFTGMQPEGWLAKHTAISDEDFAREPHRNKLNILLNRTNHQSYHLGQLIFLK